MTALHRLRRMVLFGVAGAVVMAVLLPGLALVRDTAGHDWYAAGKLVAIEAMIVVGFDPRAITEYRAADGSIRRITRLRFTYTVEAWQARSHILSTIADNALLGAGAGFAWTVLAAILAILAKHRGSDNVEVLSQTESGTRAALLVTPAEMGRMAATLGQARGTPLLPDAEPDRNSTADTPERRLPDGPSSRPEQDAGSADQPKSGSGATGKPGKDAAGPSAKSRSGRDGESVAKEGRERYGPDYDGDWF